MVYTRGPFLEKMTVSHRGPFRERVAVSLFSPARVGLYCDANMILEPFSLGK
ncbi:unnamed protein product [Pylaiella littoralis]